MSQRYLKADGVHWHRVIAEKKIGRKLRRGEVVHHINGNSLDNRPSNLQILPSQAEHARIHRTGMKMKKKPNCNNGHPLSGENLKITSQGSRSCRKCARKYDAAWKRAARRARGLMKPGRKPNKNGGVK